jgi:hypothetical protein
MLNDLEGELVLLIVNFFLILCYSFSKLTVYVCLYCNLLLTDKLYFIDFEYGSYSYRGYDIANHFNEYAGFDCEYDL